MSFRSWAGGIATVVIGAILISQLKEDILSEPDLKILEVKVDNIYTNEWTKANFTVYNEGKVAAERCKIKWTFFPDNSDRTTSSEEFGLMPNQQKQVQVPVLYFSEPGTFHTSAKVEYYYKNRLFSASDVHSTSDVPLNISVNNRLEEIKSISPIGHTLFLSHIAHNS